MSIVVNLSNTHRINPALPNDCGAKGLDPRASAFADLPALGPLIEIAPASAGDAAAALGFSLACACALAGTGPVTWAETASARMEMGEPAAQGLALFGLAPDRLVHVRARAHLDALWACEQALAVPDALALMPVAAGAKLGLVASRRLLLAAERHASRCLLLRLDLMSSSASGRPAGTSAAWTRWRVAAAPSRANGRDLGRPAFAVRLERNRAGPTGGSWHLEWNAHERVFTCLRPALDGAAPALSGDRPAEASRARAG